MAVSIVVRIIAGEGSSFQKDFTNVAKAHDCAHGLCNDNDPPQVLISLDGEEFKEINLADFM